MILSFIYYGGVFNFLFRVCCRFEKYKGEKIVINLVWSLVFFNWLVLFSLKLVENVWLSSVFIFIVEFLSFGLKISFLKLRFF